jgi:hypothetical protein
MDSDVAVLKDPLAPFSNPYRYDVQGLTDWQHLPDPELRRGFTLRQHPCMLYYLRSDPFVPGESSWTEAWHANHQRQAILNPHNPCQSTGLWFVEPTEAAVAFMRAMVDRIAYHAPYEWDQTAWNEVLMPFLWGAGDDPPLRYRVLPYSVASNLGAWVVCGGGRSICVRVLSGRSTESCAAISCSIVNMYWIQRAPLQLRSGNLHCIKPHLSSFFLSFVLYLQSHIELVRK